MDGNASTILLESNKGEKPQENLKFTTSPYQTPDNVLESPHSYYNYMKENYTKRIDGAMMLKLTFDEECFLERNCDKLYIYDESGKLLLQYTGADLAHQIVYVTGSYVRIYLTSDGSVTNYGFRCTVEDATDELEKVGEEVVLESDHPYKNNMDTYYTANISGAMLVKLEFDSNTELENNYDKLYIYNSANTQVGYYTGTGLKGKTLMISDGLIKIRLKTDSSVTKNGFKCTVTGYKIKGR